MGWQSFRVPAFLLILFTAATCETGTGPMPPDGVTPTRVVVTPPALTLAPGSEAQLQAVALDENGDPVEGLTFEWLSTEAGVSTVTPSGRVNGVSVGASLIVASLTCCGGIADTVDVEVEVVTGEDFTFPNQPEDLPVIRNTTWTDFPRHDQEIDFDGWSARYPWEPVGYAQQGSDAVGPHVQVWYPSGMPDGHDAYTMFMFPGMESSRKLYFGSVEQWGPDDGTYDHNGVGVKIWHFDPDFWFFWVTQGEGSECTNQLHMVVEAMGIDARDLEYMPGYQSAPCLGSALEGSQIGQMPGTTTLELGRTFGFEVMFDLDEVTSTGRRGTVRWWIDGELVAYAAGLADEGLEAVTAFWYSGTWGGGEPDGQVDGDQWRRLYRTVIAGGS